LTSPDATETELRDGAWVPCEMCQDFWCLIHLAHVHDCACPPIEEWVKARKWPYGNADQP
jgi:hypothetical protein